MSGKLSHVALRTSLLYALVAAVWILVSDKVLVALVHDAALLEEISVCKGWMFVAVTALLLFGALRAQLRRWEQEAAARRLAEGYLAEAQRLSHTGSFGWNVATDEHIWSEETFRIFEYDSSTKITTPLMLERVHPDDRTIVQETLDRAAHERRDFDYAHRLLMPDGSVKHLRIVARCVRQESGNVEFIGAVMDVTEQKKMNEKLRRSEFYLSEGERLTHAGSWSFTHDGICDYWSPEEFTIFGFDPAKGVPTIAEYLTAVHPDDRDFMKRYIENMIAKGLGGDVKYRTIHPVRGLRIMRSVGDVVMENGKPVRFIGTTLDITEQEQLTQELRLREMFLAEAQRLSHTGSFGWNVSTGEILFSDETFRHFEYDASTKVTLPLILERTHPDDIPLVQQLLDRAADDGKDFNFEHRLLMPNGSVKHVHVVAHAAKDKAGNVEFIGAVMDMTAAKQAEEALQEARAELARVTRVTMMGELAASIAHEVNQPLAGVVTSANAGLNWLAKDPPNLPKTREAIERILRDGTRAGEVLARIRSLLKRTSPTKSSVSVNQIVRDVLALAGGELRQKNIELSVELNPGLPAIVGDSIQLQQVLLNLIMNAIEAMTGITNRRKILRVQSELGELDGKPAVSLKVSDTGIGFSTTDTGRLFEAFHTTKPEGLGMGLWISRSIIEGHGGRLSAQSNDSPGAIFRILLPSETGDSK